MFCRQCEQTAKGMGCSVSGVCGKDPKTSDLQDLLIHNLIGIAFLGKKLRDYGIKDEKTDLFIKKGLFTTVTNVNFDPKRLVDIIHESQAIKTKIKNLFLDEYKKRQGKDFTDELPQVVELEPAGSLD